MANKYGNDDTLIKSLKIYENHNLNNSLSNEDIEIRTTLLNRLMLDANIVTKEFLEIHGDESYREV